MDDEDVQLEVWTVVNGDYGDARKWKRAIHNKVFTSWAYTFHLPDGDILRNGMLVEFGAAMTAKTRSVDVKTKFCEALERGPVTVTACWEFSARHLDLVQFKCLFHRNHSLESLYLVSENWETMFALKKEPPTESELQKALSGADATCYVMLYDYWITDSDGRAERLYDSAIDRCHRLMRRDVFTTEADVLRVYGKLETVVAQDYSEPLHTSCVCV
jgi:hypothetical protein